MNVQCYFSGCGRLLSYGVYDFDSVSQVDPDAFAYWDHFARSRNLLVTGGSDFHEQGDKHADIGEMLPYWTKCSDDAHKLLAAINSGSV